MDAKLEHLLDMIVPNNLQHGKKATLANSTIILLHTFTQGVYYVSCELKMNKKNIIIMLVIIRQPATIIA